jgi:hypothetical protein
MEANLHEREALVRRKSDRGSPANRP